MTPDLFQNDATNTEPVRLAPGAVLLRGFAASADAALWAGVQRVLVDAPLRRMVTPGGLRMSVAMSNCGSLGWVSDRRGYSYERLDPETGKPWPTMPQPFFDMASAAAARAGFDGFVPDACLINRYEAGTRLSLHQDRNEHDYEAPIVSLSLGIPAVFLFGGAARADKAQRVPVSHGDVVAWGGPARLHFHGVLPVKEGRHPLIGDRRFNITLRKAG